jgi:carboxyl-terminal processing protease
MTRGLVVVAVLAAAALQGCAAAGPGAGEGATRPAVREGPRGRDRSEPGIWWELEAVVRFVSENRLEPVDPGRLLAAAAAGLRAEAGAPPPPAGAAQAEAVEAALDRYRAAHPSAGSGEPLEVAVRAIARELGDVEYVAPAGRLAAGANGGRSVSPERAPAEVGAVACRVLDDRILYLAVGSVSGVTASGLGAHAARLAAPPSGAILDLRGSPGGLLEAARDVADRFVARGPLLSIEGRAEGTTRAFRAKPDGDLLERVPLVVLVDGGTGSGSEAIAAAIQDGRRGTVLGVRTAGKARIEALRLLPGGAAVKVRTARLLRASGEPLDGAGVTPDVAPGARPGGPAPSEAGCPGFASTGGVAADPLVAQAAALLR